MYNKSLRIFYRDEMRLTKDVGYSKSPNKPYLFTNYIQSLPSSSQNFILDSNWNPFDKEDFYLAHTKEYVDYFFFGVVPFCESNFLKWSPEFADNVRYTNASLYHAMEYAVLNPDQITLSPTSGFHHALPDSGNGYCTFSGQVIASLKLYDKYKISGAYVDLDFHFGNSIDDSRKFCKNLNKAIPIKANINPTGNHEKYIISLTKKLEVLRSKFNSGELSYIVVCSGADSLVDDDLGGSVSLSEWIKCKEIVYEFIKSLNKKIPVIITLFGGYREDHYESVIDAHVLDIKKCFSILMDNDFNYNSIYKNRL